MPIFPRTAKVVAVRIGSRQCEQGDKGVMCPSFKATGKPSLSPGGRGMAGHFGLEAEHYEISQTMALFPALRAEPQAATIANGFSRQQQIANGGFGKPKHLAQILYAATQKDAL